MVGLPSMKFAWYFSVALGLVVLVTGVLRERGDVSTLTTSILWASIFGTVAIIVALNAIYWRVARQRFGGTNRHRVHVLTSGQVGVLLLAFQVWFIGAGLLLLAFVIYTHNIWKATEHVRLFGPPPKVEADNTKPSPTESAAN